MVAKCMCMGLGCVNGGMMMKVVAKCTQEPWGTHACRQLFVCMRPQGYGTTGCMEPQGAWCIAPSGTWCMGVQDAWDHMVHGAHMAQGAWDRKETVHLWTWLHGGPYGAHGTTGCRLHGSTGCRKYRTLRCMGVWDYMLQGAWDYTVQGAKDPRQHETTVCMAPQFAWDTQCSYL